MLDKTNPLTVIKDANNLPMETMHQWTDQKKKEFVGDFELRTEAAAFIMEMTVSKIAAQALEKKFISTKHIRKVFKGDYIPHPNQYGYRRERSDQKKVGGRDITDLTEIAEHRAHAILSQLPPLKTAVQIIDKETAKLLDKRDNLLKKGRLVQKTLEDLRPIIKLADVDQEWTIAEFRKFCKDRARKQKRCLESLDDIGKDGSEIEQKVNKRLFAGLPGLSDAVVKVLLEYQERVKAMSQMGRRVKEQVMYGDSSTALDLLKRFETDELELEGSVKEEFANAMTKLKLAGTQSRAKTKAVGTKKKAAKKTAKKKAAKKKAKKK